MAVLAVALAMAGLSSEPHDLGVTVSGADDVKLGAAFAKLHNLSTTEWERLPDFIRNIWPAAGFVDTEIGCFMKPEVGYAAKTVWA